MTIIIENINVQIYFHQSRSTLQMAETVTEIPTVFEKYRNSGIDDSETQVSTLIYRMESETENIFRAYF